MEAPYSVSIESPYEDNTTIKHDGNETLLSIEDKGAPIYDVLKFLALGPQNVN